MRKYYEAYEERYKAVHQAGLLWFGDSPTPEVLEWITALEIPLKERIADWGCGEGRDAIHLAQRGYRLAAYDISAAAVTRGKELAEEQGLSIDWQISDLTRVSSMPASAFKWAYSVGTLHMLVDNEDRKGFLESLFQAVKKGGKVLLVNKGDGMNERVTKAENSFQLEERVHPLTGKTMTLAATSYKALNWERHIEEVTKAGFTVDHMELTSNPLYQVCMTVQLTKK